jgi:hypothetical protein
MPGTSKEVVIPGSMGDSLAGGDRTSLASQRRTRMIAVLGVLLGVCLPYVQLTRSYFLGYDDFREVHRAAFDDAKNPAGIFTTGHFGQAKYRPLNRGLNFISYQLGDGNPAIFRLRNLSFHLLNCVLVYLLGMLLFDSFLTAIVGALFFGLNPVAHQAVAGAVMTNTAAGSLGLLAVLIGVRSYRAKQNQSLQLALAVFIAWIGAFVYEADVTALGVIFCYFALDSLIFRRPNINRAWLFTGIALSVAVVASMLITRAIVLTPGTHQPIASLGVIAKNAAIYMLAVANPVDSLLANQWAGAPLISEVHPSLVLLIAILVIALLVILAIVFRYRVQIRRQKMDLLNCAFLLCAAGLTMFPLVVFNEHPSETYLYLPLAFVMLFLARLILFFRRSRPAAAFTLIGVLGILYGCATFERSQRVFQSATIAKRILSELPTSRWQQGAWHINISNHPGYLRPTRYGLYTYRGLDTIGVGDGIGSVEFALQLATKNPDVHVDVPSPQPCENPEKLDSAHNQRFWILPDGRVIELPNITQEQPCGAKKTAGAA